MKCRCEKMEERVTGWCSDSYFSQLNQVSTIDGGWRKVLSCPVCSQAWLTDEYDKVQSLFALKIDSPQDIDASKFLDIHIRFLLKEHGGESSETCLMAGCENKAVNDYAFCAMCLIEKQGVYQ